MRHLFRVGLILWCTFARRNPTCPACRYRWLRQDETIVRYWWEHRDVIVSCCYECGELFRQDQLLRPVRMTASEKFRLFCEHEKSDWLHDQRRQSKARRLARKYPEHYQIHQTS